MDDLEKRTVAIGEKDKPVGAGLIIDSDLVITCAHVVNMALDRDNVSTRPASQVPVRLFGTSDPVFADIDPDVDSWRPLGQGDLCLLKLPDGTAAYGRAQLHEYAVPAFREFRALGYPNDWEKLIPATGTILGSAENDLYILTSKPYGKAGGRFAPLPAGLIHKGYSGGPVESGGRIIGILSSAEAPKDAMAYMTPVSAFGNRFANWIEKYRNPVQEKYKHVIDLSNNAARRLHKRGAQLDLRLRYCADFDAALEVQRNAGRKAAEYMAARDLRADELAAKMALQGGLTLLHAPGGAGKSSFLDQLLFAASDKNLVPFLVDFGRKTPPQTPQFSADDASTWFSEYDSSGEFEDLRNFPKDEGFKALFVVDALNQISTNWDFILRTLHKLSGGALAGANIIVADRMIIRGDVTKSFGHALISPLSTTAYRTALKGSVHEKVADDDSWRRILISPLFLDLLLGFPLPPDNVAPSRFAILHNHLKGTKDEQNFSVDDLQPLADFAFQAYHDNRGTSISVEQLNGLYAKHPNLRSGVDKIGLIHGDGKVVEFRHQLLHDALAALKVASATEEQERILLRGPAFDVLSLNAASPDAVELALEALAIPAGELFGKRKMPLQPREFLSAVFDWNYWITLQCVASFDRRGDTRLPNWIRHAVYGHNLERLFDPYLHTSQRTENMKGLIPAEVPYRDAQTRTELAVKIEAAINSGEDFPEEVEARKKWLGVFLATEPFGDRDDLSVLWDDPIIGWTAANMLRRRRYSKNITSEIVRIYEISRATSDDAPRAASFRWRLVHALGRGTPDALPVLLSATLDPLEVADVRYGAVRSLIELAVTGADKKTRDGTLAELQSGLKSLFEGSKSDRVRKELRRTCAFDDEMIQGRHGWREEWLDDGLTKFADLLDAGRVCAEGKAPEEAKQWSAWAAVARNVPRDVKKWLERKKAWLTIVRNEL